MCVEVLGSIHVPCHMYTCAWTHTAGEHKHSQVRGASSLSCSLLMPLLFIYPCWLFPTLSLVNTYGFVISIRKVHVLLNPGHEASAVAPWGRGKGVPALGGFRAGSWRRETCSHHWVWPKERRGPWAQGRGDLCPPGWVSGEAASGCMRQRPLHTPLNS